MELAVMVSWRLPDSISVAICPSTSSQVSAVYCSLFGAN
jgi:hypothetical protein